MNTPHIHATVVPIVTGERRKARKKQTEVKRSYCKKANTVRLCADDVLTREKLVAYHDSYARVMEKYGLQRGVRGLETRYTTTAQYYRVWYDRRVNLKPMCNSYKPSSNRQS